MALVKKEELFFLSASSGRATTVKQLNKVARWLWFEIKGGRCHVASEDAHKDFIPVL